VTNWYKSASLDTPMTSHSDSSLSRIVEALNLDEWQVIKDVYKLHHCYIVAFSSKN
jgi:hypothetical protein